ncbi:MAG: hypothetical protein WCE23_10930 [Candidatus Binatus sp.]|uniref:hypothetical protein n=1 Tax=Candidatus Binatus sp. TaxID=2811406 RepID=UPI003C727082
MTSGIRSILLFMLGLLLGFGAAILLFRPPAIYSHASSAKTGTASVTSRSDKALAIEELACEVGLNYSIVLTGTVKNLSDATVNEGFVSIELSFPGPYSLLGSSNTVALPRQLNSKQLASFEIREDLEHLGPTNRPRPTPKDGDFAGRMTVIYWYADISKVQACWFKAAVPPPPGPPAECKGSFGVGSAYRWKDGECGVLQGFNLRWTNPRQALDGDEDRPMLLVFSAPPEAVNKIWVIREGSFPYTNRFGAKIDIPRLRVLSAPAGISSYLGPLRSDGG